MTKMSNLQQTAADLLELVREKVPLVDHITNFVTVNDCANITLAIGASPIMADAQEEAAEIARAASALVLNMGALNALTIPSMIEAGRAAQEAGVPIVFDPVGAGASILRNETAARILEEIGIDVLRGNISEIRFLSGRQTSIKGVDASEDDILNEEDTALIAKSLAKRLDCVVAVTRVVDVVTDGKRVVYIENGHPMLANLTGTGCMCSSLIGAFCAVASHQLLEAVVAALLSMGIAGEIAYTEAGSRGNGSFHMALHDAVSRLDSETLKRRAKLDEA